MIEDSMNARKKCRCTEVAGAWVAWLDYALRCSDCAIERDRIVREIMNWTDFASRLLFRELRV